MTCSNDGRSRTPKTVRWVKDGLKQVETDDGDGEGVLGGHRRLVGADSVCVDHSSASPDLPLISEDHRTLLYPSYKD